MWRRPPRLGLRGSLRGALWQLSAGGALPAPQRRRRAVPWLWRVLAVPDGALGGGGARRVRLALLRRRHGRHKECFLKKVN